MLNIIWKIKTKIRKYYSFNGIKAVEETNKKDFGCQLKNII